MAYVWSARCEAVRLIFMQWILKALPVAALCALIPFAGAQAQESRALGVVTKLDATTRQMTVKNDQGVEVQVTIDPRATFRQVAPGETSLANASTITIGEVHTGDRVLARGRQSADPASLNALQVIVMSRSDIANKQAQERADWDRRGVTGAVTEVNADHITLNMRTLAGAQTIVITPAPDAVVRRYAPDSVKFADAKPSKLADIKVGDQVKARGDKTADNAKMTAEEIVSGAFRTIAGVIVSVDTQENIVRVNNLQTKKQMNVKLSSDSSLKKLDPQFAQLIALRLRGIDPAALAGRGGFGGRGGEAAGGNAAGFPGGAPGAGGDGRGAFIGRGGGPGGDPGAPGRGGEGRGGFGGRGPGGRGGDLQSILDRTPSIALADLKTGDAIVVSSTVGASADQVTAITLF